MPIDRFKAREQAGQTLFRSAIRRRRPAPHPLFEGDDYKKYRKSLLYAHVYSGIRPERRRIPGAGAGENIEMPSAAKYIEDLQANGRFVFTTEEAVTALGTSVTAVRAALRRLKEKTVIADPARGFHVIVPPAYRALG
jgi:hypothetical protein